MKLFPLASSVILQSLTLVAVAVKESDIEKCVACYGLAEHVSRRLIDTAADANREVAVGGVRIGANGESKAKEFVRYEISEERYHDIFEGACEVNKKKGHCNQVLYEQDEVISKWFHESRQPNLFIQQICDANIPGCNVELAAASQPTISSQSGEVEVEDDPKTKTTKKIEESNNKDDANNVPFTSSGKESAATKKDTSKQFNSNTQESEGKGPEQPAITFDVIALVEKFVNRSKNNLNRIYLLSGELYVELDAIVKSKNWEKLKTMVKDPAFYNKYWIVFAAVFFVIYMVFSILEALFSKPQRKRQTPPRVPSTATVGGGAKRKNTKVKKEE